MARVRVNLTVGNVVKGGVPNFSPKLAATADTVAADVELDYDNTKITSISKLRHALLRLLDMARSAGLPE